MHYYFTTSCAQPVFFILQLGVRQIMGRCAQGQIPLQQCARIALAISASEGPIETPLSKKLSKTPNESTLELKQSPQKTQTEKLKSLLVKNN